MRLNQNEIEKIHLQFYLHKLKVMELTDYKIELLNTPFWKFKKLIKLRREIVELRKNIYQY